MSLVLNNKKTEIPLRGVIKYVYKTMGKSILEYNMLEDNDKILVGISGGADSLSLLKLFTMRKRRIPIKLDFIACLIVTEFIKVNVNTVAQFCKENNIPFMTKKLSLGNNNINCFWCSWNRRKVLFETAKECGCNKIALGHNLDDITETILMNMFFFGEISSMKPKISLFNGKLTIIRPLAYIDKATIYNFARKANIPFTDYKCLYGKDSRRELVKGIIKTAEESCPYTKKNIFNALKKIKKDYLLV